MIKNVQLCAFEVGGKEYVIDLLRVDEILAGVIVTPMPRAPSFIEGIARRRNETIPVVDVRKRLDAEIPPRDDKRAARERLLVCKIGRRRVGFMVDAVTHVIRVSRDELKPAPLAHRPGRMPVVIGVQGEAPRLRLLLDVKALLVEEAP